VDQVRTTRCSVACATAPTRVHAELGVDRVFTVAVNHVKDLGSIALLEAVILDDGSERYQDVVTTLLTAGTDRTLADRGGVTALQHAQ
jgi:hypothetical protein